jgi:outer membrane receptor protein involved in Fe transport
VTLLAALSRSCLNLALLFFFYAFVFSASAATSQLIEPTDQQPTSQQSKVGGTVVDQNGAPVSGANLTIRSASFNASAKSNEAGQFTFDYVPKLPILLTIEAPGFARNEVRLDAAREAAPLRIVLLPAAISAQVTVAATRTKTRMNETPASVAVLDSATISATAAVTLDDALRQVAGFSLFRRAGSRTANPTTQGVSLRGLGASGASRALVLVDGFPLNDPFGGWVYWDRMPRESIAQVEILGGAASHLYGSGALSGVVNITTKTADTNSLSLEMSYGNELTPDASLFATARKGDWAASLASEIFSTRGNVLVDPAERGLVDTKANSRHAVVNAKIDRWFGKKRHVFGTASFFGESRANGTPLQTNRTHLREFSFGGEINSVTAGDFSVRAYGGTQVYDQNFSTISVDRRSETLTRVQRVPAQFVGFSGQWSRGIGNRQTAVVGYESQQVRAASDEIAFVNGRASSFIGAGGKQQIYGAYLEDIIMLGARVFINAGTRFDFWRNNKALSATKPISSGIATVTSFPDRSENAFSPRLSVVFKVTPQISLLAGGMRAFRAPTLNELYRSFRVGNVLTLANENLLAERLTGGEAGLRFTSNDERLAMRGTLFWNEVTRPVANVTVATTPAVITRQRQNLGRTRSRGLELDADLRLAQHWTVAAGYLVADATVTRFPANRALEGLNIPQVPRRQFTFQARYDNPSVVTFGAQARTSNSQFDDDQNLFHLDPYFTLDVFASRRLSSRLDVFVAAENLLNQQYETGKTPVTTLGPPILVRVGLRIHLTVK